ncbi:MAG TPA: beta-ketoacyl-[acyl-carrier-protein] synthase family protein [Candidatus Tectomicrobia bacterium]|nr:beta-ketoacyl-[acyl-carrier-protein] synthase family protein [Candidatus Tectomicrobia bacterium]
MAQKPRVVITGLGAIAPNGIGKDAYWEGLLKGRSGIRRITHFDASQFPCQIAGEIADFQPTHYFEPQEAKRLARVSQFGVVGGKMAMEDSKIQVTPENTHRIGVCFGTSLGKPQVFEEDYRRYLERGVHGINPLTLIELASHGGSSHVSIALGAGGVCGTLSSGCTTGLDVIQWGYEQVVSGRAEAMIVGSAEALLSPFIFGLVCAVRVLSKRNNEPERAVRPFELNRDGIVLAEGAGALVLERLEGAQGRGAQIYAEIRGFASAREGETIVKSEDKGKGIARVMQAALANAGMLATEIDYISAHGVGLPDYDLAETNAIKEIFGRHAYNMPVSSVKPMIGQPFAASGALQAVAACLSLQHGMVPPTLNYDTPDPQCDLDYVPNRPRSARLRTCLVHAHGMGGTTSVVILGKPIEAF